ncbi:MAG: TIGR02266 family protein [Sandaracinaceae bacterium]|nr:TIGR02266 family protein [Sandaracinaceae bacterium]
MQPSAQGNAQHPSVQHDERRRYRRAHIVTELDMHSESNFYTGFTQDISEGGVFVVSYLAEPVGTMLSLELHFPGEVEICARGVVRWVREPRDLDGSNEPPGMGIQFVDLADDDRALIREFVELRAPLFFPD